MSSKLLLMLLVSLSLLRCRNEVEGELPRWEIKYSGFENVTLGGESSIGLEVKAWIPSPETKISFSGYEVHSESLVKFISNTVWETDLDSAEVLPITIVFEIPSPGSYRISFKIETSDQRTNYEYEKGGTIYILARSDSSVVVDTLPPEGFYKNRGKCGMFFGLRQRQETRPMYLEFAECEIEVLKSPFPMRRDG